MTLAWLLANCPDPSIRDKSEAIALVRGSLDDDPTNVDLLVHAGVFFMRVDRFDEAEQTYRVALASSVDRADVYNNLAWILTTRPDAGPGDSSEAIRLAEEAIRRAPKVGIYWNTLGVARYRAGRLEDALQAPERSMTLSEGGDGFDLFAVAMTLWKLGDRDSAVAHYARAVDWMELHPVLDPALRRFREEADSTLRA